MFFNFKKSKSDLQILRINIKSNKLPIHLSVIPTFG